MKYNWVYWGRNQHRKAQLGEKNEERRVYIRFSVEVIDGEGYCRRNQDVISVPLKNGSNRGRLNKKLEEEDFKLGLSKRTGV